MNLRWLKRLCLPTVPLLACLPLAGCGGAFDVANDPAPVTVPATLRVTGYAPGSGFVSAMPASVFVTFSESNLEQDTGASSVLNAGNYTWACGADAFQPTGISYNGAGVATVYLPAATVAPGAQCRLQPSQNIQDVSGLALGDTSAAVYTLGGGPFAVSSISPPSGTRNWLPGTLTVTFNEDNLDFSLDANSVLSLANYRLTCNGTPYAPQSLTYAGAGQLLVTLPPMASTPGSACSFSVTPNVSDAFGNSLNAAASANFLISGSIGYWSEASSLTLTAAASAGGAGPSFRDAAPAPGVALNGLWVSVAVGSAGPSYLNGISSLRGPAFALGTAPVSGVAYGSSGGAPASLQCPDGQSVTGIFGTYDGQIDSVGILCQSLDLSQSFASASVGGAGAGVFEINCPPGRFATELAGKAGSAVQELALACR